jgi:hypothetical protein
MVLSLPHHLNNFFYYYYSVPFTNGEEKMNEDDKGATGDVRASSCLSHTFSDACLPAGPVRPRRCGLFLRLFEIKYQITQKKNLLFKTRRVVCVCVSCGHWYPPPGGPASWRNVGRMFVYGTFNSHYATHTHNPFRL